MEDKSVINVDIVAHVNDVAHWPLLNKNLLHKINIYTLLFLYLIRLLSLKRV